MRWVVGLVLITAAVLKAVEIIANPTVALATGRWLLPLQIGIELAIGLVALSGLYWRQLRWLAAVLFAGFAAYSLYLATTGATSCGCFGPVRIHPWWTFSLDLAILLGLLASLFARVPLLAARRYTLNPCESALAAPAQLPDERKQCGVAHHRMLIIAGMTVLIVTVALLVRYIESRTATAEGILATDTGLVLLEPEKWVGQKLPIADDIDFTPGSGSFFAPGSDTFSASAASLQKNSTAEKVSDPLALSRAKKVPDPLGSECSL
jgi:hypothetical protein